MSVLLMRLAGPMQSWGTRSRFSNRDTGLEPSKSGIVGLLCAALGWSRDAESFEMAGDTYTLERFARYLGMAVRVDREGRLMRDYQTVGGENREGSVLGVYREGRNKGKPRPYGVAKADGSGVGVVVSERFYLADADFLVGLEGDHALLNRLDDVLRRPVWPLFLGRKAFVPSLPVAEGVREGKLIEVLKSQHWRRRLDREDPPKKLQLILEVGYGKGEPRLDVPRSFVSRDRRFGVRHVDPNNWFELPADLVREPIPESPHVPQQTGSQHP